MKFGKLFKHNVETLPAEWRDYFLSYKELRKLIRKIPESENAEEEFLSLLNNDIDKLNEFFIENEEEFIIRHEELQQNLKRANDLWGPNGCQPSEMDYKERTVILSKDILDLHGEMIRLLNIYSLNYTGLCKLVKKYDKRTGGVPFLQKILEHDHFLSSELIPKLLRECEMTLDEVLHVGEANEATALLDGEPLLTTTQQDIAAVVVKEGEVPEPNIEKSLRSALGKYRDNFSLQSLVPLCLNQVTYCSCWRCFLYDSANELLFCLFPTCFGKSKFEI